MFFNQELYPKEIIKTNENNDIIIKNPQIIIVNAVTILGMLERFFQMKPSKNKLRSIMTIKIDRNT